MDIRVSTLVLRARSINKERVHSNENNKASKERERERERASRAWGLNSRALPHASKQSNNANNPSFLIRLSSNL